MRGGLTRKNEGPLRPEPKGANAARQYDITPDGTRFLAIVTGAADQSPGNELIVVENWMEEVREPLAN